MNHQQIQQLEVEMQKVHNSLANALVSLHFISHDAEAPSLARSSVFEKEWPRVLVDAMMDLSAALTKARLHL
jgi:hypothetical protein